MKSVLVVAGTRPEVIKLAPVVCHLQRSRRLVARVCVTAQHRQMLDQMLDVFHIKPDFDLDLMTGSANLAEMTSRILCGITRILQSERPHYVLVQGDTSSCFGAALAAFYEGIPVGHVEAGLRTGDSRSPFPEEVNRRLTSRLCELHFAPTIGARDNLMREGIPAQSIAVTGNTIVDALRSILGSLPVSSKPAGIDGICWERDVVILVTAHRRENWKEMRNIGEALRRIVQLKARPHIVFPLHANPALSEFMHAEIGEQNRIHLLPPMPYGEFVALMQRCHLVVTDSGGIQEEVVSLGKPVVIMRRTTERPEVLHSGFGVLAGTDPDEIVRAVEGFLNRSLPLLPENPFGDGQAARRIVRRLETDLCPSDSL